MTKDMIFFEKLTFSARRDETREPFFS